MNFNMARPGTKVQPFVQLGKQSFLLEEVISDPDDRSGWTGFTSYASLVEKVRMLRLGSSVSIELEFASLTTCSWTNKAYGNYYAMLPLPEFIFPSLARRWQDLAPPELTGVVQEDRIEQYIREDGVVIEDHDLRSHRLRFVKHPQRGFVGTCKYQLRGPDEAVLGEDVLTVRQQIILLAQVAFYTGIGYKTAMGMGQVRLV
jgi:CRISPR-associated endoribonuclease Cas6